MDGDETTFCIVYQAAIAQLGERQTEDLKVPGSIPGLGKQLHVSCHNAERKRTRRIELW